MKLKIILWAILTYLLLSCTKDDFTCGEVISIREIKSPSNRVNKVYILWNGERTKSYDTQQNLNIGDTVCLKRN